VKHPGIVTKTTEAETNARDGQENNPKRNFPEETG
jgi:hypothetical protein